FARFVVVAVCFFFFSSRRRHTRFSRDWSSDVCSSDLENMKIKYTAVATDMTNQEDVVFRSGSVYNAIRASIAIPGVFKSVVTERSEERRVGKECRSR